MSLEAIEKVTEVERQVREDRAAADVQAQQMRTEAERTGQARLQELRAGAVEKGRALLKEAEDRAAKEAGRIRQAAEEEAAALRHQAELHLAEAAEFIVGRVVNH